MSVDAWEQALGALLRGPLVGLTEQELLDATQELAPEETEDGQPGPRLTLWTAPEQVRHPLARETLIVLGEPLRRSDLKAMSVGSSPNERCAVAFTTAC